MPEEQHSIVASFLISLIRAIIFGFLPPLALPLLDPTISPLLVKLFLILSIILSICYIAANLLKFKFKAFNKLSGSLFLILFLYNFPLLGFFPFSITSLTLVLLTTFLGFIIPFINLKAAWFFYTLGGLFPLVSDKLNWFKEQSSIKNERQSWIKDKLLLIFLFILLVTNAMAIVLGNIYSDERLIVIKICVLIGAFGMGIWGGVFVRGPQGKDLPTVLKTLLLLVILVATLLFGAGYLTRIVPMIISYQAEKAFQGKKYDKAISLYEKIFKDHPSFIKEKPSVHYRLGVSYLTKNKFYKASASLSRFLEGNPSEKELTPQVRYVLGLTFVDTQKYFQAIQQLEKVPLSKLDRKIEQQVYYIALAEAFFAKNKFDKAILSANKALENTDSNSSEARLAARTAHLIKYLIFFETEKFTEAGEEIKLVGKIGIKDRDILSVFEASFYLDYLLNSPEIASILKEVEYELQTSPDVNNFSRASSYTLLASFYRDNGNSIKAFGYAKKAVGADSDYLPAYYIQGSIYTDQKAHQKALEYDQKALEIDENDPLVRTAIGWTIYNLAIENSDNKEQLRQAEQHLKKAVSLDPEFSIAHNNLGAVYNALGKKEDASLSYKTAIRVDPNYKKPYRNLASIYIEQRKFDDAIANLEKAQELDPNYIDVYKLLAESYVGKSQFQKAVDELNKGIKVKPDEGGLYIGLSDIYKDLGETEKSKELFSKGISLQPKDGSAHAYNLGLQLKREGKFNEAKEQFEKAISLEPDYVDFYVSLAQVYGELKDYEKAIEVLERALKIDSQNIDIYDSLGIVYSEKEDYQSAIKIYKQGLELDFVAQDPKDIGRVYENLGLAYFEINELNNAIDAFEKAKLQNPEQASIYTNLCVSLQRVNKLGEAVNACRTGLKLDPNDALTHNNLGYTLALQGKVSEAIVEFKKALQIDPTLKIAQENLDAYQNKR